MQTVLAWTWHRCRRRLPKVDARNLHDLAGWHESKQSARARQCWPPHWPRPSQANARSQCDLARQQGSTNCSQINRVSTLAPPSTSRRTHSAWPFDAAKTNAVVDMSMTASLLAPPSRRARTHSVWPRSAAQCDTVHFIDMSSISIPLSIMLAPPPTSTHTHNQRGLARRRDTVQFLRENMWPLYRLRP